MVNLYSFNELMYKITNSIFCRGNFDARYSAYLYRMGDLRRNAS